MFIILMGRVLICVNIQIDENIIYKFLNQSITKKNTPTKNNKLDLDFYLGGYGLAYFVDNKWLLYKSNQIFTKDNNHKQIISNIINSKPKFLIGYLHNDSNKPDLHANIPPIIYDKYIFVFDGLIKNFSQHEQFIRNNIDSKYYCYIDLPNDPNCSDNSNYNKYIFYLIMTIIDFYSNKLIEINNNFIKKEKFLKFMFAIVFDLFMDDNIEIVGNFIFSDSVHFIAVRYISPNYKNEHFPPSLYLNQSKKIHPIPFLNYGLISSEPINDIWNCIQSNSYHMI